MLRRGSRPGAATEPGMASLAAGLHLSRRRGAGRGAAVERRNLLTVCRWETLLEVCLLAGRMSQRPAARLTTDVLCHAFVEALETLTPPESVGELIR